LGLIFLDRTPACGNEEPAQNLVLRWFGFWGGIGPGLVHVDPIDD
jgi:hypothetical protein